MGDGVTGLEVGQRVYGSMQGAFASRFNVPAQLLAPIPDGVSAVEAATIPAAALTVRLVVRLGAAASPATGCSSTPPAAASGWRRSRWHSSAVPTVFATASTFKRATLRKLGVEYVYDSRTTDFADQILADTGGAGVDVVLNSLTSEGFIEATRAGHRPERPLRRDRQARHLDRRSRWPQARPDIAYEIVALDTVMFTEPERIRDLLTEVSDGLANGEWTPLPAEIYPLTEARAAFRRMQQARHIGKIVLQMPNPLQPRADRSYLITGGLGAIGLHTASYLAQLGAGDIVLTSRRAPDADAQQDDRRDHRALQVPHPRLRRRRRRRGRGGGAAGPDPRGAAAARREWRIWRACSTMRCCPQQSLERFRTTLAPKAFGACHLDRLTQDDELDFFIVSSSVSSLFGSPGQANYATANALLDGLVAQRRAQGLPATGVNFGPWAQGGMASSEAATRQYRCAGPDSAGTRRPRSARSPRSSPTEPARPPSSRPTGSGPRRCWAVRVHRSSTWCCRAPSAR